MKLGMERGRRGTKQIDRVVEESKGGVAWVGLRIVW